jgi:ABC-type sugar transport system ATPase subunit
MAGKEFPLERTTNDAPIVEFRHITKAFSGVKALDDVSFQVKRGEVHCLLGENGAGKSTLIKILTGIVKADAGEILICGKPVNITDILQAREMGIGTVFQENSLIPHLSVAENVFLTRELRKKSGIIDYKSMNEETIRRGRELGVDLDPKIRINMLSVAEQQIVEIVKMFSQNPQIVILDEPTSSLSDNEINNLFGIVKKMQQKGVTFIYISHRMEEIKEIGNGGTILRDGKFVIDIENVKTINIEEIISYIVGRPLDKIYPARNATIGDVVLEVKNLSVTKLVHNVSFEVRSGEVFGLSGLVGAGRTETVKAIFGELKKSAGSVSVNGREVRIHRPHDAIRHGIGLLTENRKEEGLFLPKSVSWNIVSASLERIKKNGILNFRKEKEIANGYVNALKIKLPSIDRAVKYLSGGNQQKVVFAKWLSAGSKVYIFDEPTRGIDVGAKSEIYGIINDLAEKGNAVIVISSELPEILGVSDRIAIFHEGSLVKIMERKDATQEKIMFYAIGGKDE